MIISLLFVSSNLFISRHHFILCNTAIYGFYFFFIDPKVSGKLPTKFDITFLSGVDKSNVDHRIDNLSGLDG